jgi:hypothetical protein
MISLLSKLFKKFLRPYPGWTRIGSTTQKGSDGGLCFFLFCWLCLGQGPECGPLLVISPGSDCFEETHYQSDRLVTETYCGGFFDNSSSSYVLSLRKLNA